MLNNYIIIGAGGLARQVTDVILYNDNTSKIVYIDETIETNKKLYGFDILNNLDINTKNLIIAIGDNSIRKEKYKKYKKYITSLISKDAYIGLNSKIGDGSMILHKSFIETDVNISKCSIINTNSTIAHDCNIGDFCHISIGSVVAGGCKIGNNVFLGANSTIRDHISICDNVIIGCGSVVVKDIEESGIYIGNPVKRIKNFPTKLIKETNGVENEKGCWGGGIT